MRRKRVDPLLKDTHYILKGNSEDANMLMGNAMNTHKLTTLLNTLDLKYIPFRQELTNGINIRAITEFNDDKVTIEVPPGVNVLVELPANQRMQVPNISVATRAVPALVGYQGDNPTGFILGVSGTFDPPYLFDKRSDIVTPWLDTYTEGVRTNWAQRNGNEGKVSKHQARVDYKEIHDIADDTIHSKIDGEVWNTTLSYHEVDTGESAHWWIIEYETFKTNGITWVAIGNDEIGWTPITEKVYFESLGTSEAAYYRGGSLVYSEVALSYTGYFWRSPGGGWGGSCSAETPGNYGILYGLQDYNGQHSYDFYQALPTISVEVPTNAPTTWYADWNGNREDIGTSYGNEQRLTYANSRIYDYHGQPIWLWEGSRAQGDGFDPYDIRYGCWRETENNQQLHTITQFLEPESQFRHDILNVAGAPVDPMQARKDLRLVEESTTRRGSVFSGDFSGDPNMEYPQRINQGSKL